ncbi:hypothetical protein SprV_0501824800 [Sparganum proliferum]
MRRSLHRFAPGCANLGLTIYMGKTVVMHQPSLNATHNIPRIYVNSTQLKAADSFAHLDSTLPCNLKIGDGFVQRVSKVGQAFGRLQNCVSNPDGLHVNTKLTMYKAVILTTLLCGAETRSGNSNTFVSLASGGY